MFANVLTHHGHNDINTQWSVIGEHVMAQFHGYQAKPARKPLVLHGADAPAEWSTLEALRQLVTSNGCSQAQFDHALDAVGRDPHRVATYLQRYAFRAPSK